MASQHLKRLDLHRQALLVERAARAQPKGWRPVAVWFTGLSGSGKSTVAGLVERELRARGVQTFLLEGENLRHGLNRDLGFTAADRVEDIRRVGEVARLLLEAGVLVLCAFISPSRVERQMVRALFAEGEFIEVFTDAALDVCVTREEVGTVACVDSPYERPEAAELSLDTARLTAAAAAEAVIAELETRGVLAGPEPARRSRIGSGANMWTDRVRRVLQRRMGPEISLDAVCEELGVGRRKLCRHLTGEGATFTALLAEARRQRAMQLLRDTELPLKRVAIEAGFRSGASFCMAFKSWTGMTPKTYRKTDRGRAVSSRKVAG